MQLPIDVVPNTDPPRFRWKQRVDTPTGYSIQEHEGLLPPSVELAVVELVLLAKTLRDKVDLLTGKLAAATSQVVTDQIPDLPPGPLAPKTPPVSPTPPRKSRGNG